MCGLTAWLRFLSRVEWRGCHEALFPEGVVEEAAFEAAAAALPRRGPDALGVEGASLRCPDGAGGAELQLRASVLHLRGPQVSRQPAPISGGGFLLFNGEIYAYAPASSEESCPQQPEATPRHELPLPPEESDTAWLVQQISECEANAQGDSWEPFAQALRDLLERLHGPFALAVWSPRRRALFCGRDKLGRRSLVAARTEGGAACVSSVPAYPVDAWGEVPVTGLFVLDLQDTSQPSVHNMPWREACLFAQPWWWAASPEQLPMDRQTTAVEDFARILAAAVERRVRGVAGDPERLAADAPRVGLLFSGGLDSTVLAALAAEALPQGATIELLNVAFDRAAPDRLTALCSFSDLLERFGPDRFRLVLADIEPAEVRRHELDICRLLGPRATHLDFNIAAALWFAARGQGAVCSPAFLEQDWWRAVAGDERHLLAVRLEAAPQRRRPTASEGGREGREKCRSCVLPAKPGCLHGACKLCCRKIQFPDGNATSSKCPVHKVKGEAARQGTTQGPAAMEEDGEAGAADADGALDLGALRCQAGAAARGDSQDACVTTASSRVLLIGTGADELLGGYGRHRTARAKRGAEGVQSEMLKDLQRLWTRNLGRDDRIVADHGREARHPFLDDGVLRFIGSLPIELLAFGPGGEAEPSPDKWLLREMAARRGLGACAVFKKRAIQFGTRIAKQSNIWHAGSVRQVRGDMTYHALGEGVEP